MKKFFTLALMSLAFMACNKEENKETPKDENKETPKEENKETPKEETHPIEGTWYLENTVVDGQAESYDECRKKSNVTFSAGNFKTLNYETRNSECKMNEENGNYVISGNTITSKMGSTEIKATFSISGSTLTISGKSSEGNDYIQTWKKR